MKTKHYKLIIKLVIAALFILFFAVSFIQSLLIPIYDYTALVDEQRSQFEEGTAFIPLTDEAAGAEGIARGMKLAVQNDVLALYVNEEDSNIGVLDKRSGKIWYATPPNANQDAVANNDEKDVMKAPMTLRYYGEDRREYRMDFYTDSIEREQFTIEHITGGVRITYTVGDTSLGADLLPKYMEIGRFEEKILAVQNSAGERLVKNYYFTSKTKEGFMEIVENVRTSAVNSKRLLDAFALAGYTEEDLAFDNEAAGIEANIEQIYFTVPVEYKLNNDSLTVTVPLDNVEEAPGTMLYRLHFQRMFGAAGLEDEGYMLVPSGSGSLIELNNGKSREDAYAQIVYDIDPSIRGREITQISESLRMPVYGIHTASGGFVALIEKGESFATIRADVSGRLNNFNMVYPDFILRNSNVLFLGTASGSSENLTVLEENLFQGDLSVKYMFLPEGQSSYSDMAVRVRKELRGSGVLKPLDSESPAPFYLDIVGGVEQSKLFLGIAYNGNVVGTTYSQAEQIVRELNSRGVSGIQMRYMGWCNGGIYNNTVKSIDLLGTVGSRNEMLSLESALTETGGGLYPDMMFIRTPVFTSKGYSVRNESTRNPAGLNRYNSVYDPSNQAMAANYDQQVFSINSPRVLPSQVGKFIGAYEDIGLSSLSLNDFGTYLGADMGKDTSVPREAAKLVYQEQLKRLSGDLNLMVAGGNAYTWQYARHLVDIPLAHNDYYIVDEAVPFLQMVLYGSVDYAGTVCNNGSWDKDDYFLKLMETGAGPHFLMTYENSDVFRLTLGEQFYSSEFTYWQEDAVRMYNEYRSVYEELRGSDIVSHTKLADGVYRTAFSNGRTVFVNYNDEPYTDGYATIEAGGYAIGWDGE
jgi:hypothetical protein